MELGNLVGWMGVACGLIVPLPQLRKIIKSKSMNDVSIGTYVFLVGALSCYLAHAIWIKSPVFTVAQSINLFTNSLILVFLIRNRWK